MDFTTNIDDMPAYEQELLQRLQRLRSNISEIDAIRLNGWIRYGSPKQLHAADDELVALGRRVKAEQAQPSTARYRPAPTGYGPWTQQRRWDSWRGRYEVYWTRTTPGGGVEVSQEDPSNRPDQSLLDEIRSVELRGPRRKRKGSSGRKPQSAKPMLHNF